MFGHNDQDDQQNTTHQVSHGTGGPIEHAAPSVEPPSTVQPVDPNWQHPGTPAAPVTDDKADTPVVATPPKEEEKPEKTEKAEDLYEANDLIDIKQQALTKLSPLVGHLDQTPEEKFRTTMMMIQASDDSSMIKTAYEAAESITDEKARAQALLDIINEINYFTQNDSK